MTSGSSILGVNGRAFSLDVLKDAITATSAGPALSLAIKSGQRVREVTFDYGRGARYPHLQRNDHRPPRLDSILAPR
jgi:hypothetical protein